MRVVVSDVLLLLPNCRAAGAADHNESAQLVHTTLCVVSTPLFSLRARQRGRLLELGVIASGLLRMSIETVCWRSNKGEL